MALLLSFSSPRPMKQPPPGTMSILWPKERKRWQTTQWLKILLRNYAYHFSVSTGPRNISIHAPSAFWIIKARKDSQKAENQIGMYLCLVTNWFPRETDRKNYCHPNKSVAILVHPLCCHFLSKMQSVFLKKYIFWGSSWILAHNSYNSCN